MKKYYVEVYDKENDSGHILQSSWFNKEIFAVNWALNLDFIDYDILGIRLMSSEWDEEEDCYTDIEYEREIEPYNIPYRIREAVINFMEINPILTKLTGEKWYSMEDELVKLLGDWTGYEDDTYDNGKKVIKRRKNKKNGESLGK